MAGPLNGLGGQQVPTVNPFQPGQANTDVRQREDVQARENLVQPQGTEPAQVQENQTQDQDLAANLRTDGDVVQAQSQERGSLVDILV